MWKKKKEKIGLERDNLRCARCAAPPRAPPPRNPPPPRRARRPPPVATTPPFLIPSPTPPLTAKAQTFSNLRLLRVTGAENEAKSEEIWSGNSGKKKREKTKKKKWGGGGGGDWDVEQGWMKPRRFGWDKSREERERGENGSRSLTTDNVSTANHFLWPCIKLTRRSRLVLTNQRLLTLTWD